MSARTDQIKNYNPFYDLMRGLASIFVFVAHLSPFILVMIPYEVTFFEQYHVFSVLAFVGVEFFFALSGLLLGPILYSYFQKPDIWKNCKIFMMRRWYRTLPTYYLGFLVFALLFLVLQKPLPDHWLSYLFFLQSPVAFESEFYGVSWTMAVEEIFYIIFPLFILGLWFFKKDPSKVFLIGLLGIAVLCFVMRFIHVPDISSIDYAIRQGFLMRLDAIAYGALIGIFVMNVSYILFALSAVFLLFFNGYLIVNGYQITNDTGFFVFFHAIFIVIPVCSAIVIAFLARNIRLRENRVIRFLADISYPLYIFHVPILYLMFPDNAVITPVLLVSYIWIAIGFSYLVFKYIETPILRWRPVYEQRGD